MSASLLSVLSTCKYLDFLSLPGNTLTGRFPNYMPQPILKILDISYAGLIKDDLIQIINWTQDMKIPQLMELWLVSNNLHEMEGLLQILVESCVNHHQRELELFLSRNNLSEDLITTLKSLCEGTNVKLDFEQDIDP